MLPAGVRRRRSLLFLVAGASIGVCRDAVACSTADTARAGASGMKFLETERGGAQSGAPIFGQLIRIETLAASSRSALAMPSRGVVLDAVLVPWGVSSDCTAVRWHASAQWVPPRTRGFYAGVLRPRSQWVNGRPTLDVGNPWIVPHTGVTPARTAKDTVAALTPDEMLQLYDVLPLAGSGRESEAVVRAHLTPVLRWARDNPSLARRTPAVDMLMLARYSLQQAHIHAIRSPLAGTYRFVLTLPKGDSLAFYARTELHGMGGLDTVDPGETPKFTPDSIPLADGYSLFTIAATDPRSLGAGPQQTSDGSNQGDLGIVEAPLVTSRDSTVWRGSVDLVGALAHVVKASSWRTALEGLQRAMDAEVLAGKLSFAPGHFVRYTGGRVRYESTIMRRGEVLMHLRGERISTMLLTSSH